MSVMDKVLATWINNQVEQGLGSSYHTVCQKSLQVYGDLKVNYNEEKLTYNKTIKFQIKLSLK
jgi:hypothetical protein